MFDNDWGDEPTLPLSAATGTFLAPGPNGDTSWYTVMEQVVPAGLTWRCITMHPLREDAKLWDIADQVNAALAQYGVGGETWVSEAVAQLLIAAGGLQLSEEGCRTREQLVEAANAILGQSGAPLGSLAPAMKKSGKTVTFASVGDRSFSSSDAQGSSESTPLVPFVPQAASSGSGTHDGTVQVLGPVVRTGGVSFQVPRLSAAAMPASGAALRRTEQHGRAGSGDGRGLCRLGHFRVAGFRGTAQA